MSDTKPGTLDDLIDMEALCDFVRWATFDEAMGECYLQTAVKESFAEWAKRIWQRPDERRLQWHRDAIARWKKEGAARAAEQRTVIAKLVEENRALRAELAHERAEAIRKQQEAGK